MTNTKTYNFIQMVEQVMIGKKMTRPGRDDYLEIHNENHNSIIRVHPNWNEQHKYSIFTATADCALATDWMEYHD